MANLQDRHVHIDGKPFTIRFGLMAVLALQERWECPDEKAVEKRLEAAENADFPAILWAALRRHHPTVTEAEVLELLDDAGPEGMAGIGEELEKAAQAAQPPARPPGGQRAPRKTP